MTITKETRLEDLLTGSEEIDPQLRNAYSLGLRLGKVLDRESLMRNIQVDTTKRLLNSLMATLKIDLPAAMAALRIPRSDRKTYEKIFATKRK